MKNIILGFLILGMGAPALADLSLVCQKADGSEGVILDYADGWFLDDNDQDDLERGKIEPVSETRDSVTFLHDFGSDSEKLRYRFVGLEKCGIFGGDVQVVKMTKALRSFSGKLRNIEVQKCTCDED